MIFLIILTIRSNFYSLKGNIEFAKNNMKQLQLEYDNSKYNGNNFPTPPRTNTHNGNNFPTPPRTNTHNGNNFPTPPRTNTHNGNKYSIPPGINIHDIDVSKLSDFEKLEKELRDINEKIDDYTYDLNKAKQSLGRGNNGGSGYNSRGHGNYPS
ncbi:unnamed protein product, partial [Schistosoma turkestanicum]